MKAKQPVLLYLIVVIGIVISVFIANLLLFKEKVSSEEDQSGKTSMTATKNVEAFKRKLDQQVPRWQESYGVQGVAIGIVHEGSILYTLDYGYANKQKKQLLSNDTLFQAGSVSKSLTAWGILHLASQGLLSLDDPIEKHLTRFELPSSEFNKEEITIRRLLSHTAGLPAHKGYLGQAQGRQLPSIEESLSEESDSSLKLFKQPGIEAIYSGAGYSLLQLVIEEVTGLPFDSYMEEQILKPLGMNQSTFRQSTEKSHLSKAYGYFGQKLPNFLFTEQAAAGLKTTSIDLMKLILASMGGKNGERKGSGIVSEELISQMQTPILSENGLGLFVKRLSNDNMLFYHSGDNRGWHSFYGFIPVSKDGLVILTNSENGVDLRQDVYHAWIEYETGIMPVEHSAITKQREINAIISIVIVIALGAYILLFAIRLNNGRRLFISNHNKKRYYLLGFKMILLSVLGSALFIVSYVSSTLSLHMGNKINLILIIIWIFVLMISSVFPKTPRAKRLSLGVGARLTKT